MGRIDPRQRSKMQVLLVTQHLLVRAALESLLRSVFPAADLSVADSQGAAVTMVRRQSVDLIVTCLACRWSATQQDLTDMVDSAAPGRVVVFGECGLGVGATQALAAGAHGYIPSNSRPELIAAAISLIAAGGAYFPQSSVSRSDAPPAEAGQRFAPLTSREREVLTAVVDGLPNKAIARRLGISPRTVEVHRAHVMRKTGAETLSQLIRLALAAGVCKQTPETDLLIH